MERIGIIDADLMDNGTRHPNLALMKIAGYYKNLGCEVKLIYKSYMEVFEYDKVFISKVFTFTSVPDWVLGIPTVQYGGTGFFEDGGENLQDEIEHHMPYYDLYKEYVEEQIRLGRKRGNFSDYLDYSIGFTTRGCFRKCSFCVNRKYDKVHRHSPVEEFFDESRPYIYLWDDNFLAYPQWEEVLDSIEATGRPFQFRQGLDLRLMTDEKAKRFNNTRYIGDFIFAFDNIKDKDKITENVQLWKRYSSRVCKMYVLSGYESQDEKDIENIFERIKILMEYGCLPYIMRYESYKNSRFKGMYVELARWCNQPQFFKKKSFREFCIANQDYKKDKDTNCAAYQTMLDFEKEFPQIADKYFDLKFEKENMYKIQYGYGRKYENKPLCRNCKKQGLCWDDICKNKNNVEIEKKFIELYFSKEIDLLCLKYKNSECTITPEEAAIYIKDTLLKYSIKELQDIIRKADNLEDVTQDNIPQFSSIEVGAFDVINTIMDSGIKEMNFKTIGKYLDKKDNTTVAFQKYGENHTKLAALLDLTHVGKIGVRSYIYPSELGKVYYKLSHEEQETLARKLCLRIPIIRNTLIEPDEIDTITRDLEILSATTEKRRRSSVQNVLKFIQGNNSQK